MKILIIDDERHRHDFFTHVFNELYPDITIDHAWNSFDAERAFRKSTYDVAFFDHDLGDDADTQNGSQIASTILNNPEFFSLPKSVWVHSSNTPGALNIASKFASCGIKNRAMPFRNEMCEFMKTPGAFLQWTKE